MEEKPTPNGQKNRRSPRVQVTLDPETRERFDQIMAAIPELESLSAAIRWASRIGIKHLPKRSSSGPSSDRT